MLNLLFKKLITPSTNINYNFIAGIYAFFSLLSIILYTLETQLFYKYHPDSERERKGTDSSTGSENEYESTSTSTSTTMKELAESTKGLYLIFMPFIPCFLWSLVIRHVWKKVLLDTSTTEKKTKKE
jgi:hypothetical protein